MSFVGRLARALVRRAPFRPLRQRRFERARVAVPRPVAGTPPLRVLVLGVYLADRANHAVHLCRRFAASGPGVVVEQRWTALNGISEDPALRAVTRRPPASGSTAKFALVNRMLEPGDAETHDFVIVCDDDILLPEGFLPALLAHQQAFDWAVAQPARALHSHFDYLFVLQRPWLRGRQTRFVEIGPLVSFRRDAARLLIPFEGEELMWGLDFVWPRRLEAAGMTMGIIDAVAVDHSLRPQAATYSKSAYAIEMGRFLATTPHLTLDEALRVVRRHWR